ncbi:MAG: complex I 51 kDa subunit family protein [Bacillota bacterium]
MLEEKKFLMGPELKALTDYDFPGLKTALNLEAAEVIDQINSSGLKGRGGAGFPTGLKWEMAHKEDGAKYMICNADEGEPGTFKDRYLLENRPLKVLEGIIIAAKAINASKGYIYIRGEYTKAIKIFKNVIAEAEEAGVLGDDIFSSGFNFQLKLVRGAGAYVCGDETSLLNSIEGQRGISRIKPPYPIQKGLYGKTTVVNNVETLATAAEIMCQGADYYSTLGTEESRGTKLVCLSGDINNPGIYEVEFGTCSLKEIINELGGGSLRSSEPKCVIPGGVSTAALVGSELDCRYTYEDIKAEGSSLGSGAVIVVGKDRDLLGILQKVARFYMDETCGTCFPCREGNKHLSQILKKHQNRKFEPAEVKILADIGKAISGAARCGLGQTSLTMARSIFSKFPDELIIGRAAH